MISKIDKSMNKDFVITGCNRRCFIYEKYANFFDTVNLSLVNITNLIHIFKPLHPFTHSSLNE